MKKVLIFDYDGTIVDSLAVFKRSLIETCREHGFSQITEEDFLSIFNGNMYEGLQHRGIPKETVTTILKDLKIKLLASQHNLHFFPGMEDALKQLAQQYPLFIITSNISDVVEHFLQLSNVNYREVVGGEKEPSKVIKIGHIKEQFPDAELVYVGDTRGDIIEGREAGVKTVAVTWGWHEQKILEQEKPDYVAHSADELTTLLG